MRSRNRLIIKTIHLREKTVGSRQQELSFFLCGAFFSLWCTATPAFAQDGAKPQPADSAKPGAEKWRPKDGMYGTLIEKPAGWCDETDNLSVELARKHIGGHEWGCDITKLTNAGPGALRLDISCHDYNLAESPKLSEDTRFKEVMLLRKANETAISVRVTSNGKFKGSWWKASYCADELQRIAAGEKPTPWIPRDGIYASPGADFDERCLKSPDTVIDFARKIIFSGTDQCEVYSYNDAEMVDPYMAVVCNETRSKKGFVEQKIDGGTLFGPPGFEVMRLSRVDDNTISLQKTHDGQSSRPAHNVSYCGDEAQRQYVEEQKAAK